MDYQLGWFRWKQKHFWWNLGSVAEEIRQQLDAFKNHYGRLPDFIDGHQHVHHLPQVREALFLVYQEYLPEKKAFIRVSISSWLAMVRCLKSIVIALTGFHSLKAALVLQQISYNTSFSGVYNFSPSKRIILNYIEFFEGCGRWRAGYVSASEGALWFRWPHCAGEGVGVSLF